MSRKGTWCDNAPMESFDKTFKVERMHPLREKTRAQVRFDIVDWIEGFYDRQPVHSAINSQLPVAAESGLMAAKTAVRRIKTGSRPAPCATSGGAAVRPGSSSLGQCRPVPAAPG